MNTPFRKILIANRGEIAGRIAKAAGTLGMETVAVYAPVDALSLHTRYASETRELNGSSDPVGAYLDIEALIAVAEETGCDALHPGYGFLSENEELARRCAEANITFIGPSPEVLGLFGDKVRARAFAREKGVPTIPGSPEALSDSAAAASAAAEAGYPIMLKAAAGGGGRGMRLVTGEAEMADAFTRCASEAEAAFGDGRLFLEKRIERPRHIEVQILGDSAGNVVHLRERDCSIQIRHQKVVEIAPAPGLDSELLERMLSDAVKMAAAAGYHNAGTVEFLVSPEAGEYWFIECNPRIQVEHTITEQVMGVDLVEAQFRLAAGASLADLGFTDQDRVGAPRGFAVQARVVAQGVGAITAYKEPTGAGVRVDGNGYGGYQPPPQFDPLLAKVICTGGDYSSTIARTRQALAEFQVGGLPTNLNQLDRILSQAQVEKGDARTSLIEEVPALARPPGGTVAKGAALALLEQQALGVGNAAHVGAAVPLDLPDLPLADGQRGVEAPMAGAVLSVAAEVGARVAPGDTLFVISAMKMESVITAPCSGTIADLLPLVEGDSVGAGQTVAAIVPEADAEANLEGRTYGENSWAPTLGEVSTLKGLAESRLAPGSNDPGVVRQRDRGKLTCRERVDLLLDEGSFREVGSIAGFTSYDEEGRVSAFTPAN
ncbi:MAG: ATP-grasp domain-containing protein, partial [Gammaproteobacteria bacterium]